jgi:hypothetical protein
VNRHENKDHHCFVTCNHGYSCNRWSSLADLKGRGGDAIWYFPLIFIIRKEVASLIYGFIFALLIPLLNQRNPLGFVEKVTFRLPALIFIPFLIQIIHQMIANQTKETYGIVVLASFVILLLGFWVNRQFKGILWIMTGCIMNVVAITSHGGFMPVSERAIIITGQSMDFSSDGRHILMDMSIPTWILGDWIPVYPYILSLGDLIVMIGVSLFIYKYATRWKTRTRVVNRK